MYMAFNLLRIRMIVIHLKSRRVIDDGGSGDDGTSNLYGRILSTFLNELDGISSGTFFDAEDSTANAQVLILVACASLDSLDEALLRPGRLQYHVALGYPKETDIEHLLRTCTQFVPVKRSHGEADRQDQEVECTDNVSDEETVDFQELSKVLLSRARRQLTCSDIESLCREAVMSAIREYMNELKDDCANDYDKSYGNCFVHRRHFLLAIESILS